MFKKCLIKGIKVYILPLNKPEQHVIVKNAWNHDLHGKLKYIKIMKRYTFYTDLNIGVRHFFKAFNFTRVW